MARLGSLIVGTHVDDVVLPLRKKKNFARCLSIFPSIGKFHRESSSTTSRIKKIA